MTKETSSFMNPWLHVGSVQDAIAWKDRIGKAYDVGYVYVLALSNGNTKVGSTAYFPQRLLAHQRDFHRSGISISRCYVTRPAFNFQQVELAVKREFAGAKYFGEVFLASLTDITNFIERLPLTIVAPVGYGQSHQGSYRFVRDLMAKIGAGAGLPPPENKHRNVQRILDRHITLGRETGLTQRVALHNAMSVIEAHIDMDLTAFHHVLAEVA